MKRLIIIFGVIGLLLAGGLYYYVVVLKALNTPAQQTTRVVRDMQSRNYEDVYSLESKSMRQHINISALKQQLNGYLNKDESISQPSQRVDGSVASTAVGASYTFKVGGSYTYQASFRWVHDWLGWKLDGIALSERK